MKGPDTFRTGVSTVEKKNADKEKRDRESEHTSQQAGQASGMDERPPKTRKVVSDVDENNDPEDDPVALARRALDMFRKEVEEDGDYVEPDTTPGEIDRIQPGSKTRSTHPPEISQRNNRAATSKADAQETLVSRSQKTKRQPMIIFSHEDDPSIL
jgi:hypothetical protein